MVNVKIKLTRTLPINAKHGCFEGKEFDATYQNTYVGEDGVERLLRSRGTPVEFTGIDGARCVAFSDEYEIIPHDRILVCKNQIIKAPCSALKTQLPQKR